MYVYKICKAPLTMFSIFLSRQGAIAILIIEVQKVIIIQDNLS